MINIVTLPPSLASCPQEAIVKEKGLVVSKVSYIVLLGAVLIRVLSFPVIISTRPEVVRVCIVCDYLSMFVHSGEYVTSVYAWCKLVCCVESSDEFLGIVRLKFVGIRGYPFAIGSHESTPLYEVVYYARST